MLGKNVINTNSIPLSENNLSAVSTNFYLGDNYNSNQSTAKDKPLILNNVKNRLLILSPTVKAGLEREGNKDDFEALDEKALGKGGFGHVWKVRHKITQKIYAIKVINKDYIRKENMVDQINREIEIMYRTDHPHIIKLYNHYEDDDNFYLVMHCASKGQLYSQLKRLKRLDERTVAQYMREVISAVKYLHSMTPPIIHRDIKPENILLDADSRAKLADFGWSNFHEENKQRETYCGTPEYLAPEMVSKSGHDESIDIWSLGVLMFELLAGRPPFVYKGDTTQLYSDIKTLKIRWTDDFPILAKNLITKILKLKPSERPSLDEISDHPWFKETPVIRPVLAPYNYDPEAKLRSHLIHVNPEDEEVKATADGKTTKVVQNEKKRESLRGVGGGGVSIIGQIANKSEREYILENESKLKKEEVALLKEENAKKDKIIEDLKRKLEKTMSDESTLRIRDLEKNSFIAELEAKTKRLLETESELNMNKNEFERLSKEYSALKDKYDDILLKNLQLEKNFNDISLQLNKLDQEKQQEIMNLEMKLRICEVNYVKDNDQVLSTKTYDPDKILQLTEEYLLELVTLIKKKFLSIEEKIILQEKAECDFRTNYIDTIDKRINDMVTNFKETHERILNEEKNIFKKQLEEAAIKNQNYGKNLEWYKQQINELFPYKQKFNQGDHQISKLTNDLARALQTNEIIEEKNKYLTEFINIQNEKMINMRNAKEIYKNAFLESEKLFKAYIKNRNLRDLINFNENFPDPC